MKLHPSITSAISIRHFNRIKEELPKRYPHLDFTESMYTVSRTPITVKCTLHGYISVRVTDLLRKRTTLGCNKCSMHLANNKRKLKQEEFMALLLLKHGKKYNYEKTCFLGLSKPITVTCLTHGDFVCRASRHLEGTDCQKCKAKENGTKLRNTFEYYLPQIKDKHGKRFTYDSASFVQYTKPMSIHCEVHGWFTQSLKNHLDLDRPGVCPECRLTGFKKTIPATLYYLRVGTAYKIGITNRSVAQRYSTSDREKFTVISEQHFALGRDAYEKEQSLLKKHKRYKYVGVDLLESGNSELFSTDVLELDVSPIQFKLKENK